MPALLGGTGIIGKDMFVKMKAQKSASVQTSSGTVITFPQAAERPLSGLNVYGHSTQDGTPSPENPVPIVSAGDSGEINVTVSDGGTQSQTLTLSTPGGLPGIPVSSGGNYTDADGRQWVCDEIDLARGKYVQRINQVNFDGSNDETWMITGDGESIRAFAIITDSVNRAGICDRYIYGRSEDDVNQFDLTSTFLRFNCYQKATTPDEWKLWLQSHPITVLYALATPIETDLPAEEIAAYKALHTYSPTTTVTNDAEAWMKVGYNEFNKRTF